MAKLGAIGFLDFSGAGTGEMSIARRLTSGLAWAGLALVIAVPSADFVTSQFVFEPVETTVPNAKPAPAAAVIAATPKVVIRDPSVVAAVPVATAAPVAEPVVSVPAIVSTPEVAAAAPIDRFAGKPQPSYLTDDGEAKQTADAPKVVILPTRTATRPQTEIAATPVAPIVDPIEVATVNPTAPAQDVLPPVPMPAEMRPRTSILASVVPSTAQDSGVLIVDTPRTAAVQPAEEFVSADELDDWESGPLADFLAQRNGGFVADPEANYDAAYDPDGFFLEDGPNAPQRRRPPGEFPADEFQFSFDD